MTEQKSTVAAAPSAYIPIAARSAGMMWVPTSQLKVPILCPSSTKDIRDALLEILEVPLAKIRVPGATGAVFTVPEDAIERAYVAIASQPRTLVTAPPIECGDYEIELPVTIDVPTVRGELPDSERQVYSALGMDWVAICDEDFGWQYHLMATLGENVRGMKTATCRVKGLYLPRPGAPMSAADEFLASVVGIGAGDVAEPPNMVLRQRAGAPTGADVPTGAPTGTDAPA